MPPVELIIPYFPDPSTGKPLYNGFIYVGEPDTDPIAFPKTITLKQQDGVVVPTIQPVRTGAGGVPVYNGSPVTILVDGDYSLKVTDRLGTQVYYIPSSVFYSSGFDTGMVNVLLYGTLELARTDATAVGKTIIVSSALSQAQSNLSGAWPADRSIMVAEGGSINNSTAFTVDSNIQMFGNFVGAGAITFNGTTQMFGGVFSGASNITVNGDFTAGLYPVFSGSGVVQFSGSTISLVYASWFLDYADSLEQTRLASSSKTVVVTSALTQAQSNITAAWPSDRALRVEKGGSIANSTAFTINGPFEAGLYQVFNGAGAITGLPVAYPEWWGVDGIADNIPVGLAVNATALGGVINLGANTYVFDEYVTIDSSVTIKGGFINVAALKGAFYVTGSDVTLDGVTMTGTQNASIVVTEMPVNVVGASAASPITGFRMTNCNISNFGYTGIWADFITDFTISNNSIFDVGYAGIIVLSGIGGDISNNNIDNIKVESGSGNAYGIAVTRVTSADLTTYPRSSNVTVSKNKVSNVLWEGIDTHGGSYISVDSNIILGCTSGISAVAQSTVAPLHIVVNGNIIDSLVTDGSFTEGIRLAGVSGGSLATGVVSNNIVIGHGKQSTTTIGGMLFRDTDAVSVVGNLIINPSSFGVVLNVNNYHFVISGNTIIDPWSETSTAPAGITVLDNNNTGRIQNNIWGRGAKIATYVLVRGATFANKTIAITYKDNTSEHSGLYELVDSGYKAASGSEFKGSKTYDPASMATMTGTSTTVTAAYCKLGDSASVSFSVAIPAGVLISAIATANDIVTVSLFNTTGGPIDIASGTLSVVAERP